MKTSKICEAFALFAKISQAEAVAFMPVISAVKAQTEARLKESRFADEYAGELEVYCGARVYCDYLLSAKSSAGESGSESSSSTLKIGGVSVSEQTSKSSSPPDGQSLSGAKALLEKYERSCLRLFADEEFSFRSTNG